MGRIRDSARTRARIIEAAAKEFAGRGFDGVTLAEVARRARLSKQLIHHHFHSKEGLFREVHDMKFRPTVEWQEALPPDPADLFAARFRLRARDVNYVRFLTWEAASGPGRKVRVPGYAARQRRVAEYGSAIRLMQLEKKIRSDLDPHLLQLAILALSTYPMAFWQITQLVTGRRPSDPDFQRDWYGFLKRLGQLVFKRGGSKKTLSVRKNSTRKQR
jgi:TetR/AcrR family transcriptional regulator